MMKWVNKQQDSSSFTCFLFSIFIGLLFSFIADNSMANSTDSKKRGKSTIQQIHLTTDMIVSADDYSAEFLVDEQQCSPNSDLQPVSETWQPFLSSTAERCAIYFDLGQYYTIRQVLLHNVYEAEGLEIYAGEPGAWIFVTASDKSNFNAWKGYDLCVNTRYLRLGMQKENVASINEVLLFGDADNLTRSTEKSTDVFSLPEFDPVEIDFPKNNLTINYDGWSNGLKINVSPDFGHSFTIDIYNLNGYKVYTQEYINLISAQLLIDVSKECGRPGMYIVHYYNSSGISKTVKFQKSR